MRNRIAYSSFGSRRFEPACWVRCGVVGAERRLEYTIIGDTVNLAARLESTTKEYGVPLLASEATAVLLDDKYEAEALGEVKVKGKHASTKIFAVKEKGAEVKRAAPV